MGRIGIYIKQRMVIAGKGAAVIAVDKQDLPLQLRGAFFRLLGSHAGPYQAPGRPGGIGGIGRGRFRGRGVNHKGIRIIGIGALTHSVRI